MGGGFKGKTSFKRKGTKQVEAYTTQSRHKMETLTNIKANIKAHLAPGKGQLCC